ncbi:transcriptional regulator, Fur family [Sulfurimonas gotlandica GD1]|uniref:Transcriptional regulator, Fur family n=1 Tax=Sulfurimonas gotlandica (strain DSM 19862 / JCM 16533 / GD1) TaxID=929558 RepID=B6BNZ5_SULGG|nr:Fur family transcriptional regulator [Sulfurimonas gotlandica]EDZ61170.1 peroxide stress regulator [Sulfurimonas gotlandica GD1]EHP29226.1 transcriptional regulator, Fur family [Sulfurimonas gotlandica GD1]
MINYTDELRRHNLKATPQRLAISNALHSCGHINIDTLYELMLKKFASISLATIYKNVHLMLENSYIQEVKIPQSKTVYELTKTYHSHLVCTKCGEVEDIKLNMKPILSEVNSNSSFEISKTDVVLSGTCKNCQ